MIGSVRVVFDSDVYVPDIETNGESEVFVLPCFRGQKDYEIHLLKTAEALIIKEGRVYLCTYRDGVPQVLTFIPVPADRQMAITR